MQSSQAKTTGVSKLIGIYKEFCKPVPGTFALLLLGTHLGTLEPSLGTLTWNFRASWNISSKPLVAWNLHLNLLHLGTSCIIYRPTVSQGLGWLGTFLERGTFWVWNLYVESWGTWTLINDLKPWNLEPRNLSRTFIWNPYLEGKTSMSWSRLFGVQVWQQVLGSQNQPKQRDWKTTTQQAQCLQKQGGLWSQSLGATNQSHRGSHIIQHISCFIKSMMHLKQNKRTFPCGPCALFHPCFLPLPPFPKKQLLHLTVYQSNKW